MNANIYNQVKKFNTVAGQLENVTKQSLALQMELIQEEYLELVQAFDDEDDEEYLDATADLFVTVAGLMQKLEAAGFNVEEAMNRVAENNLDKFPLSRKVSFYRVGRDEVDFADEAPYWGQSSIQELLRQGNEA